MKKESRMTVQLVLSVVLIVFGIALLICGFFAPPVGEIHSSVLVAYGEVCTFAGALIGIDYTYRYRHSLDKQPKIKIERDEDIGERV